MFDMGFLPDVRRIVKHLPAKRQTLLFSATFADEIRELATGLLDNPAVIEVAPRNSTAERIEQLVHPCDKANKIGLLSHLVTSNDWQQVLVFTRTKHMANRVAETLDKNGVSAAAKPDAPGVYVDGAKIASLGLRIRNGRSFHGLALNVDMDLAPFRRINPCGYAGLEMVQCKELGGPQTVIEAGEQLIITFSQLLGYQHLVHHQGLAAS